MDLRSLLVLVVILGFLAWLVTLEQTPLPPNFKWLIATGCWILAVVLVLWAVLTVLGIPAVLKGTKVGALDYPVRAWAEEQPTTTAIPPVPTTSTTLAQ